MYIVLHLFQVSMQYWLGTLRLLLAHLQEGGARIITHNHGVCPAATTVNAECLMPLNSVWRCVLWVLSELSEFKTGIITSITRPASRSLNSHPRSFQRTQSLQACRHSRLSSSRPRTNSARQMRPGSRRPSCRWAWRWRIGCLTSSAGCANWPGRETMRYGAAVMHKKRDARRIPGDPRSNL